VTRRALLRVLVKTGLLASVAAFAGVFAWGLVNPRLLSDELVPTAGIAPGTARLDSWRGRPVWVLHRSDAQMARLGDLAPHVAGSAGDEPGLDPRFRALDGRWGVYLAATGRQGILVRYSRSRPPDLPRETPWHGGFVDPGSDAVFDHAGRPYRGTGGRALAVPPHRLRSRGVELGHW